MPPFSICFNALHRGNLTFNVQAAYTSVTLISTYMNTQCHEADGHNMKPLYLYSNSRGFN